jgi:hypothetical protein
VKLGPVTLNIEQILKPSENRVLTGIFGPKGGEGTGGWRKLRNEELHKLYVSLYIIRVMNSRRMRWARQV